MTVRVSPLVLVLTTILTTALAQGPSWEEKLRWQGEDYYGALGLENDASKSEIKKTYRKLSLEYHPDKTVLPADEAKVKFYDISQAYEVLKDDVKRKEYTDFIASLPSQFRPIYGQSRLWKPGVWAVVIPFFTIMIIGISILQIGDFSRRRSAIMATPVYKRQIEIARRSGQDTANVDKIIFKGMAGWSDTLMFRLPVIVFGLFMCKPCRENAKRNAAAAQLAAQEAAERAEEEAKKQAEMKQKREIATKKRELEAEQEKKLQDERKIWRREDFINKRLVDLTPLLEMLGLSHLSKQELLSLLKDRNDVCDGVDEFISELEAKESDDRKQRLEEEMRLQEEEEERQRQELMNNDLYGDDNGDACATVEDEGDAEIDEEWLAEIESAKQEKLQKKNAKKKLKNQEKERSKELNAAKKAKEKELLAAAREKKKKKKDAALRRGADESM
jgi:hypothetical protein|eukprot:Stramenopile-MAST_4_protein_1338